MKQGIFVIVYCVGVAAQAAGVVLMILGETGQGAAVAFGGIIVGTVGAYYMTPNKEEPEND